MKQKTIFNRYTTNLFNYIECSGPVDEDLMRDIEQRIDVAEQGADDFRRLLAAFLAHCSLKAENTGKMPSLLHRCDNLEWDVNPELKKAIESYCNDNP